MSKFKLVSFSKEIDKKFKRINLIVLAPILLWPFFFLGFMVYYHYEMYSFILAILYPFYLCLLFEVNARIYKRHKAVGYIIPILIGCLLSYEVLYVLIFFISPS